MAKIVQVYDSLMSIRHAPYKPYSALAELIDNSLQAKAKHISVIAIDGEIVTRNGAALKRLESIAVLDDGEGMDKETLQSCLGVGFSRNKQDKEGIGKFGYGMTVGSISQAFRVEVYSWQKGGPIIYTYIDIPELGETNAEDIPDIVEVDSLPILQNTKDTILSKKESGTLVVWKNLDLKSFNVLTAKGVYSQMSFNLGRIYRHFLDDDDVYGKKRYIEIVTMDTDGNLILRNELVANDPLYLLKPNTLSDPYNTESTNLLHGDVLTIPVEFEDGEEIKTSMVEIRFAVAKPEIRQLGGAHPVGKHYKRNLGISFVRASREIQFGSFGFVNSYDPRERWWGLEVRFKPELDEVFGVSADKQSILNIKKIEDISEDYFEDALENYGHQLNIKLNTAFEEINRLREIIKASGGKRGGGGAKGGSTTSSVNKKVKKVGGETIPTDSEEVAKNKTREEKLDELIDLFRANDPTLNEEQLKNKAIESVDFLVDFQKIPWPGNMFLERKPIASGVQAQVNINSKFYTTFYEYLENADDPKGAEALKIILMAFIRTEDELKIKLDSSGSVFSEFRERWGYWVTELIDISEE